MKTLMKALIILLLALLIVAPAIAEERVQVKLTSGETYWLEPVAWECGNTFCTFTFHDGTRLSVPASQLAFVISFMY